MGVARESLAARLLARATRPLGNGSERTNEKDGAEWVTPQPSSLPRAALQIDQPVGKSWPRRFPQRDTCTEVGWGYC